MKKIVVLTIINMMLSYLQAQNFIEINSNVISTNGGTPIWGDYDNDGDEDLFISGTDDQGNYFSKIYKNNNGILQDINADIIGLSFGADADWGDYDNDGDLDLLIAGSNREGIGQARIYRNDNNTFIDSKTALVGIRMLGIAQWGDYNSDGKLDALLSGFSDDSLNYITKIYKNINNGFVLTDIYLPASDDQKSSGWVDYDGDGDLDIYVPGRQGSYASIYVNNKGTFSRMQTNIQITGNAGGSDWIDFDNDGDLDIAVMGLPYTYFTPGQIQSGKPISRIYRNDNNRFVDLGANLTGLYIGTIKWIDFDLDGDFDIVVIGADLSEKAYGYLYRNDNGTFTQISNIIVGLSWSNLAIGDVDNDNKPDIIVCGVDNNYQQVTKIYKNNTNDKLIAKKKKICGINESVQLFYAGDTSKIKSYEWNIDGGNIISGTNNLINVNWNSNGEKSIKLILKKDTGYNDTLSNIVTVYPGIDVSIGNDTTVNSGDYFLLDSRVTGGTSPYTYYWNYNVGNSDYVIKVYKDTTILSLVSDKNGCIAKDLINVTIPANSFAEQICLVTVDTSSGKNAIIWEKTPYKNIKEYNILKETTVGGTYSNIGTVQFSNKGIFIDQSSNPFQHADRYKIATIDSSGYRTGTSEFHQTIHLAINQGLPGTYNLMWTPYWGFEYATYYIYKGTTLSNLQLVDSVTNTYNQYSDTAASVAYYQITVRKDQPCNINKKKANSDPYSQSVSNIEDNIKLINNVSYSTDDYQLKTYPVPFSDELNIEYPILKTSNIRVSIYDMLGKLEYKYEAKSCNSIFKHKINTNSFMNPEETYVLQFAIDDKIICRKIIRQ